MINWKVRIKNLHFWLAIVPALAFVAVAFADVFGIKLELGESVDKIKVLIGAVFAVLVLVGVVNDPTTNGLSDSDQALTYTKPKE